MKHLDEESNYEIIMRLILKTLSPFMTLLMPNWVKKELNLFIMYQQ